VKAVIGTRFDRIALLATLAQARCPVLLLHRLQDSTVPVADARVLMQHKASAQVTLLELAGTHEGFVNPAEAEQALLDCLRRATCSEALAA
jgi:pimeloyl-ACP methyl ester carboxylesterase